MHINSIYGERFQNLHNNHPVIVVMACESSGCFTTNQSKQSVMFTVMNERDSGQIKHICKLIAALCWNEYEGPEMLQHARSPAVITSV